MNTFTHVLAGILLGKLLGIDLILAVILSIFLDLDHLLALRKIEWKIGGFGDKVRSPLHELPGLAFFSFIGIFSPVYFLPIAVHYAMDAVTGEMKPFNPVLKNKICLGMPKILTEGIFSAVLIILIVILW